MALNEKLIKEIEVRTEGKPSVRDALLKLLKGVDESKQLKRIFEAVLKTI